MAGKQSSAMDKAEREVTAGKLTGQEAAVKFGLSFISITRKAWYKKYRQSLKQAAE